MKACPIGHVARRVGRGPADRPANRCLSGQIAPVAVAPASSTCPFAQVRVARPGPRSAGPLRASTCPERHVGASAAGPRPAREGGLRRGGEHALGCRPRVGHAAASVAPGRASAARGLRPGDSARRKRGRRGPAARHSGRCAAGHARTQSDGGPASRKPRGVKLRRRPVESGVRGPGPRRPRTWARPGGCGRPPPRVDRDLARAARPRELGSASGLPSAPLGRGSSAASPDCLARAAQARKLSRPSGQVMCHPMSPRNSRRSAAVQVGTNARSTRGS